MNLLAFIFGIFIAISVIIHLKKTRLEHHKLAYALLLMTFPFYYIVFAIYGSHYAVIPLESLIGLLFIGLAVIALKLKLFYKLTLLATGYILHGIYDVAHHQLFINAGTPVWWPEFCGVIDILLGGYLIYLAFKTKVNLDKGLTAT